jgi:chitinase
VPGSGVSDKEKYSEVVYIGSEVFQKPTALYPTPYIMVFPSSKLPKLKTITLPLYTTTLKVEDTTTVVVAVSTVRTATITVINFFNHYVTTLQQPGGP